MLLHVNAKLTIFLLSSNDNLFQFLKTNWSYTFLIYVQAFWCTTKEVRQQDIILTNSKFDFTEATYLLMKT